MCCGEDHTWAEFNKPFPVFDGLADQMTLLVNRHPILCKYEGIKSHLCHAVQTACLNHKHIPVIYIELFVRTPAH